METVKTIRLFPAGTVVIPPSKSLSHRALICAGLAAHPGAEASLLSNMGQSQDTAATMACMARLGVRFTREGAAFRAEAAPLSPAPLRLDCGESGSTLRFLIPLAARTGRVCLFTGRGRLMQRPMEVYETLFRERGLLYKTGPEGLVIQGPLPSGDYRLPGDVSSQFISGLLFALPLLADESMLTLNTPLESAAYADLTLDVMEQFGVTVERPDDRTFCIPGGGRYHPAAYRVEGDYSQAAFFLAAGALGRPVRCGGMSHCSRQGDAAITGILERMGAAVRREGDSLWAEAVNLHAIDIDAREIPDLVPPLAALCCLAKGTSHITGAARLRIKESDRLDALATELQKLGAEITQGPDSLTITGKETLRGGRVDAHGDHRIAMALAVAAIRCEGPVLLTGWENVQKSYPDFWRDFEKEALYG